MGIIEMVSYELGKELRKMFFILSRAWDKEKILSPYGESYLRPSDSALGCSTTEPQRLYGERGLLRSSYDTRPAYCVMFVDRLIIEMVSYELGKRLRKRFFSRSP